MTGPTTLVTSNEWHVLRAKHQHEKAVAQQLQHRCFEVFLPLYQEIRQWSDRRRTVSLPLFPGYVFFAGGLDRRLELLSTPGVCSLVMSGDKVATIPAHELDAIRQIIDAPVRVAPLPGLVRGERVRITKGPLSGLEGTVARLNDSFRLVLSVEMLSRSVAVEVAERMAEKISAPDGAVSLVAGKVSTSAPMAITRLLD